jgi:peptidoglycan/xylan/chitin deacetylase (PgdA/CDA1 family)/predicted secreted Zn-dependent protease
MISHVEQGKAVIEIKKQIIRRIIMKQIILFIVFTNILFANVIALTSGEAQSGNVAEGAMSYYKISATNGKTIKTILNSLTDDGDLYIKVGSKPTTSAYDCRSIRTDTRAEDCSVTLSTNSDVFIGIHGYKATAYQIKATIQGGNGNNVTTLTSGTAVTGSVTNGETKHYKITATQGQSVTSLLSGLTADSDIYVKVGEKATSSNYDCKSTNGDSNNDSCTVTLNKNDNVFIAVFGYKASNYNITATVEDGNSSNVTTLVSGVATAGSIAQGKIKYYKIAAQAGQTLTSLLDRLSADSDIYVKIGEKPTTENFDCNSENSETNSDGCSLTVNTNADIYLGVYGFRASNYNITATLKNGDENVTTLTSGTAVSGSVIQGGMKYYKIAVTQGKSLKSLLNELSADLDLYVKIGDKPTTDIFDCSSENDETNSETCTLTINSNSNVYLGVYGYRTSSFKIKATIKNIDVPGGNSLVVYEDAEDQSISRWTITDNIPAGATVTNVYDSDKNSRVIKFNSSDSYENQYQIGAAWNNRENFNITWDMKTTEGYMIDVEITTTAGDRNLRYNDNELSYKLKDDTDIIHGLGYHSTDGTWHTFRRDLLKDLKDLEPNNNIISVNSFLIRAKARIDNIELFTSPNKIYEDAEDNQKSRWSVYSGPSNAQISNINDSTKSSRVIKFQGNNADNKYMIGNKTGENNAWADTKHSNLKWSFKSSSSFKVYLFVKTQKGNRQIKYSNTDIGVKGVQGNEIYFGLGNNTSNGKWHTFIRDIAADVKQFDNDNSLLSVDGLLVVGNSRIDDLELFNVYKPKNHKAGFSLTFDDYDVNGWYSMRNTYLKYNVKATFFVSHFHTLSAAEINKLKTLESDGNEIGCHTYDHEGIGRDYQYDSNKINAYISKQITPALNNMRNAGFSPVSLAYPFGERNKEYDNAVRAYFPNLRTTASDNSRKLFQLDEIFHKKGKHYTILAGDGIDNSYDNEIPEIREAFVKARENGEIITFYCHQVLNDANNHYAISPQKLKEVIETAHEVGLKFYTFKKAYALGQ